MNGIGVFAPAKINLSLQVGPPQTDGRHPLDSLVAFTQSCGDYLRFNHGDDLALTTQGPFADGLDGGDGNLIIKAARILSRHASISAGATITLTKNLPIASGIGGGSADAAATLIGLNQLWQLGFSRDELAQLGGGLGADVPACVLGKTCMMTGTGEVVMPLDALPPLGIVLVNPLKACPTGDVYRQYDQVGDFTQLQVASNHAPELHNTAALLNFLARRPNDLELAAQQLIPEIGLCLEALAQSPDVLLARMSALGRLVLVFIQTRLAHCSRHKRLKTALPASQIGLKLI
ncbi:MAG: 4-(cytidine 5'-diphospho)-2-C-methyl-D-erythritol kinase [Hyphomonadaceae bacterium]|nr:4-(cytidine 5'-diphospho)-2-C-methyl-D-erythritol kinase [Hyphomonadaceae bacterium]